MNLTKEQSVGLNQSHLDEFRANGKDYLIHKSVIGNLTSLMQQAERDGVAFTLVSSYRSFEHQLAIWNDKWSGQRPIYSATGELLDAKLLTNTEKFKAISHWSALPGLSRHHWGTDFDIFDCNAISKGYKAELVPEEFSSSGVCYKLEKWLTNNLKQFGFFRPYLEFKGGVAQEPWHISHLETSQIIMQNFDMTFCKKYLKQAELLENDFIQEHFEQYYQQYFCNICQEKN